MDHDAVIPAACSARAVYRINPFTNKTLATISRQSHEKRRLKSDHIRKNSASMSLSIENSIIVPEEFISL